MRFSLRLNNDLQPAQYEALARAAEEAGFDQFWVSHDLFLRSASVILPLVARATTKIEIGSCIFNPYTINPAELAMFAATMDEVSGNRFNLGLAAGAKEFLRGAEARTAAGRDARDDRRCATLAKGRGSQSGRAILTLALRSVFAFPAAARDANLRRGHGSKNAGACR